MTEIVLKPMISTEQLERDLRFNRHDLFEFWQGVEREVQPIIEAVRREGDQAVCFYTEKFEGCTLRDLLVPQEEIKKGWQGVNSKLKKAIATALEKIRDFHLHQTMTSTLYQRNLSYLGELVHSIERVGCYIPGGRFPYPSSCLMTIIPAQIAGVKEIAVFTPPAADGSVSSEILACCALLGVHEVYRIGGAQAIAAACFGTESVKPVDKIVGPGNIYVTAAKKLLHGIVGTDLLAGPSEVVIIADESTPPEWIALDLLAQAEHDPMSLAILVSWQEKLLLAVKKRLERELQNVPFSFEKSVPLFLYQVESKEVAFEVANFLAPEHLELATHTPFEDLKKIQRAGSIFLGPYAPVALGDYGYGPNHVLPTYQGARFASPLSVRDFYTISSFIFPHPRETADYLYHATLAQKEGLWYHYKSLLARFRK